MTKPIAISEPGLVVSADVAAVIGPILKRELQRIQRVDAVAFPADAIETTDKLDLIGAWWRNKNLSSVSPDLSSVAAPDCDPVDWIPVKSAAEILKITPQAVTGLLARRSLHGEKSGGTWRVCSESVSARKESAKCTH